MLFARHGYAGTTVRMIGREAGVSTGLLYAYFESKEGLLRAIFEDEFAGIASVGFAPEASVSRDARMRCQRCCSFGCVGEVRPCFSFGKVCA